VSACRDVSVSVQRDWGRGRKTGMQCIQDNTREQDPRGEDALDRCLWRGVICGTGNRPTHASAGIRTLKR
jgi:hypothetical protein